MNIQDDTESKKKKYDNRMPLYENQWVITEIE